ncbi:MAG TPA: hypothetical protein VD694_04015, partial [Nitrososphaeraceae archaeon]|nr:hypothetical protein [Nitrososphaeraceae archaeon]
KELTKTCSTSQDELGLYIPKISGRSNADMLYACCPVMRFICWSYYCIVRFIRNFSLPFLLLGDVLRGHLQHGQTYPS